MENKNEIKNLNENEVEKVAGGLKPLNKEKGYWVDAFCYKCKKEFKKYVDPMGDIMGKKTGRPSMCPECMRKWREKQDKKYKSFDIPLKEILKREER